jgi:hypothetical protein
MFTWNKPAAAKAPGCGGIRQCTEYREVARTVAIKGIGSFDFALKDFARPLNIINAESQNIGKPVINPVIPRAWALLFSPVFDRINCAILKVPPVLSRVIPIIAPSIIRNPIEAIVFPKPSLIVLTIVFTGRVVKARKRETIKRAIKALSFSLVVRIIMAIMLIPTSIDVTKTLIYRLYVKNR